MKHQTAVEFVGALAGEDLKNSDRFKALVWWYGVNDRSKDATPGQIAKDMEAAGYGRQTASRVGTVLRADRRFAKGEGKSFLVKVTKRLEFDETYHRFAKTKGDVNSTDRDGRSPKYSSFSAPLAAPKGDSRLPALFIGSSAEGLKFARALEKQLEHDAEVTIWKDGVFGLGGGTLETLVGELPRFDFAALVLTEDDLTLSRKHTDPSPRDNVVFELGLFMGHLGRFRTFIVYNKDADLKLPSDLAGVTSATFRNRADGNYHAQMSPPSTLIIDAIHEHGPVDRS
jgi:predicted nucleotide-binding protein